MEREPYHKQVIVKLMLEASSSEDFKKIKAIMVNNNLKPTNQSRIDGKLILEFKVDIKDGI